MALETPDFGEANGVVVSASSARLGDAVNPAGVDEVMEDADADADEDAEVDAEAAACISKKRKKRGEEK